MPLSYSFAKTCYMFSGIQLLITLNIIFIQLLLYGYLVSSMQPAWYPASIYGKNYFDQSSFYFYFHTGMFLSIPLPFRETVFFHQSSFHFKVTISNNFVDEMSLDEVSVDEVSVDEVS